MCVKLELCQILESSLNLNAWVLSVTGSEGLCSEIPGCPREGPRELGLVERPRNVGNSATIIWLVHKRAGCR